jgi:hypothetical protein
MCRRQPPDRGAWPVLFLAVGCAAACVPWGAQGKGLERPPALDAVGVRTGGDWLTRGTFHEDPRLGSLTQIVRRRNGELAMVGTHAAVFWTAADAPPRAITFRDPAGAVELVEWPGGSPRYLDRGGGGWQTGALLGEDGVRLWQPDRLTGMDDMAAGDLDGDGIPEMVVGYNGGSGVHLYDAAGKQRWRKPDGNVWHVEVLDTDGDGRPEILHSNAAGQLTLREANGSVRASVSPAGYFSQFSPVEWPRGQRGLIHATDEGAEIVGFDGQTRVRLAAPDSAFLMDAHATAARLGNDDFLVLTLSMSNWDRTQLAVFDRGGALRYREVVAGTCDAVAALDPDAFLFGCSAAVQRYSVR